MRSAALVRLFSRFSRWPTSSMVQRCHTTIYSRNPIVQQILKEYAEDGSAHCKRDVQREIEEMREKPQRIEDLFDENFDFEEIAEETNFEDNIDPSLRASLSPEQQRRYDGIVNEIKLIRRLDGFLPTSPMSVERFRELMAYETRAARLQHLRYLALKDAHDLKNRLKKAVKRRVFEKRREYLTSLPQELQTEIHEALENTYIQKHNDKRLLRESANRLISRTIAQSRFGSDCLRIALDLSFQNIASERGRTLAFKQLREIMMLTHRVKIPHLVDFVNVPTADDPKGHWWPRHAKKSLLGLVENRERVDKNRPPLPLSPRLLHGDLLDHYDRRRIVYLTPDAKRDLTEVDDEHVYVIGCIVKDPPGPYSASKAKRLNLPAYRLPLRMARRTLVNRHDFNLNHVVLMLLYAFDGISWPDVFDKTMPQRNIEPTTESEMAIKAANTIRLRMKRARLSAMINMLPLVPGDRGYREDGDENVPTSEAVHGTFNHELFDGQRLERDVEESTVAEVKQEMKKDKYSSKETYNRGAKYRAIAKS